MVYKSEYKKFKFDLIEKRCWGITEEGKEVELLDKSYGFNLWKADDWEQSGRCSWLNFSIKTMQHNKVVCFHKLYDDNIQDFFYYRVTCPLKDYTFKSNKNKIIEVEFKEDDRVIKKRHSAMWTKWTPDDDVN